MMAPGAQLDANGKDIIGLQGHPGEPQGNAGGAMGDESLPKLLTNTKYMQIRGNMPKIQLASEFLESLPRCLLPRRLFPL